MSVDATLQANSVETVHNGREVGGYLEWDVTLTATNWARVDANHGVILSARWGKGYTSLHDSGVPELTLLEFQDLNINQ